MIRDIALNVSQDAADFNNDFDNIIGLATNVVDYGYDIGLNTEVTSYDYKIGLDEDAKRLLDSEERESVEKDEKISQATQVLESTRDQFMRDSARSSMTLEQALSE